MINWRGLICLLIQGQATETEKLQLEDESIPSPPPKLSAKSLSWLVSMRSFTSLKNVIPA